MRKMFSKNQIKRLIETDMSGVTVTKGEYTTNADVKINKLGNCITITGEITVNNTSGAQITNGLKIITLNNIDVDFADTQAFNGVYNKSNNFIMVGAYVSGNGEIYVGTTVPTGELTYYFDIDLIDSDYLPVEEGE